MRILWISIILTLCGIAPGYAAIDQELTLDQQIAVPAVPTKHHQAVVARMSAVASELTRAGFQARPLRNGQVVLVTIPCAELFEPNGNTLRPSAEKRLATFRKYLEGPIPLYKMVIAVHSDDTGDQEYRDTLTAVRAEAIEELICGITGTTAQEACATYGLGDDEPLGSNATKAGRDRNRRTEIYIVPDTELINTLSKKK